MNTHSFQRVLISTFALALIIVAAPSSADHPDGVLDIDYEGVAIKGYDPVAYFVAGRAVRGSEHFSYEWLGVKWLFASADNRRLFAADPMSYAPQYGGYCSTVHLFEPGKADINPTAWRIVKGQLYLFYEEGEALEQYGERSSGGDAGITWDQVKAGLSQ